MLKQAFTLMELMIVMVIIGIMASWGIPQYGRSIERARARNAINNLTTIYAANLLYQARHAGNSCPADNNCTNLTEINNINGTNSLSIIAGGVTYACADGGGTCTGVSDAGAFTVTLTLANPISAANPSCASGGNACP